MRLVKITPTVHALVINDDELNQLEKNLSKDGITLHSYIYFAIRDRFNADLDAIPKENP